MDKRLDQIKERLVSSSQADHTTSPPQWLPKLLDSVPGLPADAVPHHQPRHADLQSAIAQAAFHPAIEACLHLINGDLYSAHFLVRKAQGGSRYLDWLHAILHKLEGDFRNAKMWYTDLGNTNAGDSDDRQVEGSLGAQKEAGRFRRFHEFWFVPASNGGSGRRSAANDLDLENFDEVPLGLRLTAHGHTDLVFLSTLAQKASSSSAVGSVTVKSETEKHHRSTTEAEDKIKDSQSAFDLDELSLLFEKLAKSKSSRNLVRGLTQLELIWMLTALAEDFGWRHYGMADTIEALKLESTPAHQSLDDDRKTKASNMVFNPAQGQRNF